VFFESDEDQLGAPLARRASEYRRRAPGYRFDREIRGQPRRLMQPLTNPVEVLPAAAVLQCLLIDLGEERHRQREGTHDTQYVRVHAVATREQLRDVKRCVYITGVLAGDEQRARVSALRRRGVDRSASL
jgi:hypothetical protein